MNKITEVLIAIGGGLLIVCAVVFGFNYLHCNPIGQVINDLLPKVAVAPVTAVIAPGSVVKYGRNKVEITPPKAPHGQPQPKPREIWHPVELKPWVDKNNVLHVPQSGFCLVALVGGKYDFKSPYWEVGARLFVAGQFGLEPSGNDRGWSPRIDYRPFDANILLGVGPDFGGLSFNLVGASVSAKFDLGLFQ